MKRLLFLLYSLISATLFTALSAPAEVTHQKILIVNSYRGEVVWSNTIASELREELLRQHPHLEIHIEHLNANNIGSKEALNIMLRSVFWSFARNSESERITNNENIILQTDTRPDIIVFIGDDGLLAYQNLETELGSWKDIPLILCGVNSVIVAGEWDPEEKLHDRVHIPIEDRRYGKFAGTNAGAKEAEPDKFLYNITGVKIPHPVLENLKLVQSLIPDLKEIVWVDNYYYASEHTRHTLEEEIEENYPHLSFSSMTHNQWNTDSIYHEITTPSRGKAYMTHAWDIHALYRDKSKKELDSLFRKNQVPPLFSLSDHPLASKYWIGGYYLPKDSFIKKTALQITRVLNGEVVNEIPFEIVNEGYIKLNKELINKYKLTKTASCLKNVEYVNIPPSFYKKNEKNILITLAICVILILIIIYWWRINKYNKVLNRESMRYKKLSSYLQAVYEYAPIDFALYDEQLNCTFCIVNGKAYVGKQIEENDFFSLNLAKSKYLNEGHLLKLFNKEKIDTEILLNFSQSNPNAEQDVFQLIVIPLDSQKYKSVRYISVCSLLTPILQEKKEIEHYERLFQFASEYSEVGIAYYNIQTAVGKATPAWYKNLNEPPLEGALPKFKNVVEEDRKEILNYYKRVLNKETTESLKRDIRVLGSDGKEHWIEQHFFVREETPQDIIELNLNIDLQKQSEEELIKAKQQAEQSNTETEQFIQSISHEVRTPLNSIVGFSGVLAHNDNEEEKQYYTGPIRQNCILLQEMVENIIELSNIDSGKRTLHKEKIKFSYMLETFRTYFYNNLYGKKIVLETTIPEKVLESGVVYTDRQYLYQLATNLVSNAIKFTASGGTVTFGYEDRETEHCFYVKDTGYGISPENQEKIFTRFEKVDTFMQGTGLGLPLCKRIAKFLGGDIGVESEAGKGSTFWWTIPK